MKNHAKVNTSAESLHEVEGLIKKAEAFVEHAAASIYSEVRKDVHNAFTGTKGWLEYMLPALVIYRKDHARMYQDMEKLSLYLFLLAMTFLMLSPLNSRSYLIKAWLFFSEALENFWDNLCNYFSSSNNESSLKQHEHHSRRRNIKNFFSNGRKQNKGGNGANDGIKSHNITDMQYGVDEETDEARFALLYPGISSSRYGKLVLPPECTYIEKPKPRRRLTQLHLGHKENKSESSKKKMIETEEASTNSLKTVIFENGKPDKNGYVLGDDMLPNNDCTPLLVLVNTRSGPQQGPLLITQLRRLLNPIQVWDLGKGPPEPVLESFCALSQLRILVCGGDGTVAWIVSAMERLKLDRRWPPIAILPLGTGNDLARIHGWGGGYNSDSLITILEQVAESYISLLDRWQVTIEDSKHKKTEEKNFFNYLGVGADAEAALQVHELRESNPHYFFSRIMNKLWYGIFGAEDILKASYLHIYKDVSLYADGVEIPLPEDSQGIIVLNIDSYAGGVPLWSNSVKTTTLDTPTARESIRKSLTLGNGQRDSASKEELEGYAKSHVDSKGDLEIDADMDVKACELPSSCQDGILEVVSIRGTFHLGQIRVGLSDADRLCQCRELTIKIKRNTAVQLDGEPWRQSPCVINVKRMKEHAIMLHRSVDDVGVETEMSKLLDWAEEQKIIDSEGHMTLMKEFSRRIENKNRMRLAGP